MKICSFVNISFKNQDSRKRKKSALQPDTNPRDWKACCRTLSSARSHVPKRAREHARRLWAESRQTKSVLDRIPLSAPLSSTSEITSNFSELVARIMLPTGYEKQSSFWEICLDRQPHYLDRVSFCCVPSLCSFQGKSDLFHFSESRLSHQTEKSGLFSLQKISETD